MADCLSCKDDRKKLKLAPAQKVRLPVGVTDSRNFRMPKLRVVMCPHCDGETAVSSALAAYEAREGS